MTKQEFTDALQEIGTCESDTDRRSKIAQLIEDGGKDYDDHAAASAALTQANADNEALRKANMDLFKRIGDHSNPNTNPGNDEPKEKRRFENLFDDKGGLK